jgi:hypothetical protein
MKRFRAITVATFLSAAAAAAVSFVPSDAHASVSIAVLFDELVERASAASVVTPIEQRGVWENGRIYTYSRVHIDSAVAGALPEETWVRTMGGVVGKIGQTVDGEAVLTVGRPSLLFLQPVDAANAPAGSSKSATFEVTARAQGQFPIKLDEHKVPRFIRAFAVGVTMPPPPARIAKYQMMRTGAVPLAAEVLHERTVEEAKREIAAAWSRLHAK